MLQRFPLVFMNILLQVVTYPETCVIGICIQLFFYTEKLLQYQFFSHKFLEKMLDAGIIRFSNIWIVSL